MPSEREILLRNAGHLTSKYELKDGFETKAAAKHYIARARGPMRRDELMVYRCRACPNWHIGHKPW